MLEYEIKKAILASDEYKELVSEGWEPYSITQRFTEHYDGDGISYRDGFLGWKPWPGDWGKIVWFRKQREIK